MATEADRIVRLMDTPAYRSAVDDALQYAELQKERLNRAAAMAERMLSIDHVALQTAVAVVTQQIERWQSLTYSEVQRAEALLTRNLALQQTAADQAFITIERNRLLLEELHSRASRWRDAGLFDATRLQNYVQQLRDLRPEEIVATIQRVSADLAADSSSAVSATADTEESFGPVDLIVITAEVALGTDLSGDTKRKRIKRVIAIIVLLYQLLSYAHAQLESAENSAERGLAALEIAELKERIHALSVPPNSPPTGPLFRLNSAGRLRAGPSADTDVQMNLPVGTLVIVLSSDDRWRWIEVLDVAGKPSGHRGWIYRRVLTNIEP